jgi:predicted PurR-regulated permease PerM
MPDVAPSTQDRSRHEIRAVGQTSSGLRTLAVGVIVTTALYFGREVFVPLALAILLSFALGPLVLLLRRWHFGRVPSIVAAVMAAFLLIFGIGVLLGSQLAELARNLPQYETNIAQKIHSLRVTATDSGIVARASEMLTELGNEIARTTAAVDDTKVDASGTRRVDTPEKPILVEIRQTDPGAVRIIERVIGPLLGPLTTTGIVIVFVIFFLLQREDLRDRFIRLAGSGDLRRTTEALDDAAHRLSRYLLMQTAINASFGVLIGGGLWLIGVPNPILLGVLAMLLRFVPYIGAVIGAALSTAVALAVDPGWSMLLWAIGLFATAEVITGQLVEPHLYSHSTGLSAVAVVVAAVFWTWLWGPIGLLLSTPLTVCLVVLGRHVDRLEFLDVILGNEPALAPEESFYQRMLVGDPDEAANQAEDFLKEGSLSDYYDDVAIKGLALAQADFNRGTLDHRHRVQIREAVDGVIDDLSDHVDTLPTSAKETAASGTAMSRILSQDELPATWRKGAVMCIAGRGSLDEAAAAMLAQLLEKHGIGAQVVGSEAVSAANLFALDVTRVQLACLSYLEPGGFTSARYLARRLRRRLPSARIFVGFWTLTEEGAELRQALTATGADLVVTSLRNAVEQIVGAARDAARENPAAAEGRLGAGNLSAAE